jgi:hypothetical protein
MTGRRQFSTLAAAVVLAILCGIPPSYSAPEVWSLRDVKFDDGGTAKGSFIYDASLGKILGWDIVAFGHGGDVFGNPLDILFAPDPGCTGLGCDSASRVAGTVPLTDNFIFEHGSSPSSNAFLSLVASRPLTNGGGIVSLIIGTPPDGSYLSCCEAIVETNVVSGFLASAPEPGTVVYLLGGIMALAGMQWARRRPARARAPG